MRTILTIGSHRTATNKAGLDVYIKSITIENVKSFRGQHHIDLGPGVNFFVGDNNSGKSTVMEALLFLFEGPSASRWTPETFYSTNVKEPTRVQVDIADGVDELVQLDKFKRLADFIFDDDGHRILRLDRSSAERSVKQGGKDKTATVKQVCFWNAKHEQFENVTGIDASVKALFEFEAVWADSQPGDYIDFASTKTLGRLLDTAFTKFTNTERWRALAKAHDEAFSQDNEDSFMAETKKLAADLKELVDEQYGEADYRFDFGLPDAAVFMKQGRLNVDDGAGETPVEGKGTGMRRAIALGVIQLYAKSSALTDGSNPTPLILMLDEPETWLHPTAQLRLGEAVNRIGEHDQILVVTHSPYLIRKFVPSAHHLTVLHGQDVQHRIDPSTTFGLFGIGEPTWGEINYRAFGICSNDFHNELYGRIGWHIEMQRGDGQEAGEREIDNFLHEHGEPQDVIWRRTRGRECNRTLSTFVRNSIHHPENQDNPQVTPEQLEASTRRMISIVEELSLSQQHW